MANLPFFIDVFVGSVGTSVSSIQFQLSRKKLNFPKNEKFPIVGPRANAHSVTERALLNVD